MFGIRKVIESVLGDIKMWQRLHESISLREQGMAERCAGLLRENERLLKDQQFFMHRLNQVEMERAQLIHAAIGIKLAVPTFKAPEPTQDEILNNNGNPFIGMGEDSPDPQDQLPHHQDGTEDLSHMPGFNKR